MAAPQGLSEKKVEAAMRFPQKCIKACACAHYSAVRCAIYSAVAIAQLIIGEPVVANPPVCTKSNDKAYLPLDRTFALPCGIPHSARRSCSAKTRGSSSRCSIRTRSKSPTRNGCPALHCAATCGRWVGHATYRYVRRDCCRCYVQRPVGRDQGEHLSCGAPQGEGASVACPAA